MEKEFKVQFEKPIIKDFSGNKRLNNSWEPISWGFVTIKDDGISIFGPSSFSFIERWFSGFPIVGPILIHTLFETIRQKNRHIPCESIAKVIAATRPKRSSFWDGGDSEAGLIHILIEEKSKEPEVCAFSIREAAAFWNSCSNQFGFDKMEVRDEKMKSILTI